MDLEDIGTEQTVTEVSPLFSLLEEKIKVQGGPCALSQSFMYLQFQENLQLRLYLCNTLLSLILHFKKLSKIVFIVL